MTVFGSEMHIVTFLFIVCETVLFFYQLFYFIHKPSEKSRIYFVILLFLLIMYNISSGLFPDKNLQLEVVHQNIIAYGTGFFMACYFPYYFYKAFDLKAIRFHALFGIWLFIFIPFLVFIGIEYSVNHNLEQSVQRAVVIPFCYAIFVVAKIFKEISLKYKDTSSRWSSDEFLTYLAITPWVALPIVSYFQMSQLIETLLTNSGFIIITILFCRTNIVNAWEDERKLANFNGNLALLDGNADIFLNNCQYYNLTAREIEIVSLIRLGNKYSLIGEELFISEKTVSKHVQNIYRKTDVNNKIELIYKLEDVTT